MPSVNTPDDLRVVRNFFDAVNRIVRDTGWTREKAERVLASMYRNEPAMKRKLNEPREDDGLLEEIME